MYDKFKIQAVAIPISSLVKLLRQGFLCSCIKTFNFEETAIQYQAIAWV